MDHSQGAGLFSQRLAIEWDADFSTRRSEAYGRLNEPFALSGATHPISGTAPTAQDIIESLTRGLGGDVESDLYQADVIEGFCKGADFETLREGVAPVVKKRVALLDDRNEEGSRLDKDKKGTPRKDLGALSSHQLYRQLEKPRYKSQITRNGHSAAQEDDEPDADRRLIYITDLDRYSLLALVATAPHVQAQYLRDFVFKHLTSRAFIGLQLPSLHNPFPSFALEFHLPYYAWRTRKPSEQDARCRSTGDQQPLRHIHPLDFLSLSTGDQTEDADVDCICEAEISCLVSGIDHWSWVAYAFVDTYYQGEDNAECVTSYRDPDTEKAVGFTPDALSWRRLDANRPVWKPKEYFIRVLEPRAEQVKQEWLNTVSRFLQAIEQYTDYHTLPPSQPDHRLDQAEIRDQKARKLLKIMKLLQLIASRLSRTLDSWNDFKNGDIVYFLNVEGSGDKPHLPHRCLRAIDKHMSELRDLQRMLGDQKALLQRFSDELRMHIALDDNTATVQQQRTGENVRILTIAATIFLPLTTTSAIFSVQEGVLPVKPTLSNFITVFFCLTILLGVVFAIILKWPWYTRLLGWLRCADVGRNNKEKKSSKSEYLSRTEGVFHDVESPFSDDVELEGFTEIRSTTVQELV